MKRIPTSTATPTVRSFLEKAWRSMRGSQRAEKNDTEPQQASVMDALSPCRVVCDETEEGKGGRVIGVKTHLCEYNHTVVVQQNRYLA